MPEPLQSHNSSILSRPKTVFLSQQKSHPPNCNILHLFQHNPLLPCTGDSNLKQPTQIDPHQLHQTKATKLSKKSLKSHSKLNSLFQNTAKKELTHFKEIQTNIQKKVPEPSHKFSRQPSKVFSKTTSSELEYKIFKKAAAANSQTQTFKLSQHSHKYSSDNLVNSFFQRPQISQSCRLQKPRMSHIPMVQSISRNSIQFLTGNSLPKQLKPLMNPEANLKFRNPKFVNSLSQSFDMLGISPVKQIIIPQVSERSGINSNPSERQRLSKSKNVQFNAPPQIRKNYSEDYSQFLRSTQNRKVEDSIKDSVPMIIVSDQQKVSNILVYDQTKNEPENNEREFLEISFEKEEEEKKENTGESFFKRESMQKQKSQISIKKSQLYQEEPRPSQMKDSKIQSTSSKVFSASGKQIQAEQIREVAQEIPQSSREKLNKLLSSSSSESNKEMPNESQFEALQSTQIVPKIKAPKLQHIPYGRHSVQIPRSKKFSGLQVRRTVSMRDQEQSDEQETSEVVYGFRKTHKEAIIQEVNEEMQESCVTRNESSFSNNMNLSDFRQLLR